MEESKINELRKIWERYRKNSDKKRHTKNAEIILSEWAEYSKLIKNNKLSLDQYTNRLELIPEKKQTNAPSNYLCYFLETESRMPFGSCKPGNAYRFMVKLNDDGQEKKTDEENTYYVKYFEYPEKPTKKKELKTASRKQAEGFFKEVLLPFFSDFLNLDSLDKQIKFLENNHGKYEASQMLYKMLALEHQGEFLYLYSDDYINTLYQSFIPNKEQDAKSKIRKSHQISKKVRELLDLESSNLSDMILMSFFLWELANAQSLVDENSPNVILYGPPGTGKTYQVKQMLDFVCKGDDSRYEILQFHPSFTYEDFIEGIKPKGVDKTGNIKFGLVNGVFKKFCMKAKDNQDMDFYFVVDEINRANLSSVFGETLSLLEKDYRHIPNPQNSNDKTNLIKTQYSSMVEENNAYKFIDEEAYFGVPKNVFFIGMMNDVDKSIDTFDLALRRRFKWIRKDCDYEIIENHTKRSNGENFNNIDDYSKCAEKLNNYISEELGLGKSYEFGHSFFMQISSIAKRETITKNYLSTLFDEYLRPTLKEYLRAFYSEIEIEGKNKTGNDGMLYKALEVFQSKLPEKKQNETS